MSDARGYLREGTPRTLDLSRLLTNLTSSRRFQTWAARFPLTRRKTRREGEALFDLMAGFIHSQCLMALIELGVLEKLRVAPTELSDLALSSDCPADRLSVLMDACVALGILARKSTTYRLTVRGAALASVPGLTDMISHHRVLYRDLSEPAEFFRGETDTELSKFWPYVFGAGAVSDPSVAARYSRLMSETQALVAEETLAAVNLRDCKRLMDVGGGVGTFLSAALGATPNLEGVLFDLPHVVSGAPGTFSAQNQLERVEIISGSFRDSELPEGADMISLVRVLYDHADSTVADLLSKVFRALPSGGRLMISEPMTGGSRPTRAGNAYYAIYTLAMNTGRTRSAEQIASAAEAAGFVDIEQMKTGRPFVTSVIIARKP